jgi:oligopeptide/dipeptide ABC transporter ATP-binding protein
MKMEKEPVVSVKNLRKYFPIKLGFFKSLMTSQTPRVRAVDDVSFSVGRKEVFGLVGESGCGKTTTGRCILRLVEPTAGKISFEETDMMKLEERQLRAIRKRMQIIFQDPYESLNPRMSIYDILAEPLNLQNVAGSPEKTTETVSSGLEEMDLVPPEEFLYRFPHELSGGQRQRVAIARAFVLRPEFIVADEPVSMLDASIRTEVMKLMLHMVDKTNCSFLYITHDIALTRYMCDRIAVMYLGKIVETGPTEVVIGKRLHPYTEALISAVPVPDPTSRRTKLVIKGEVASAVNPPKGCRFNTRCLYATDRCRQEEPQLVEVEEGHFVACLSHAA